MEGDENRQEEHLAQLVLCQLLTAMAILRTGGDLLCKIFDVFTPFTASTFSFDSTIRFLCDSLYIFLFFFAFYMFFIILWLCFDSLSGTDHDQ